MAPVTTHNCGKKISQSTTTTLNFFVDSDHMIDIWDSKILKRFFILGKS